MKKYLLITAVLLSLLAPAKVMAEQYGQGTYGQGVVLGDEEVVIEHAPIEAGLKENLVGLAFASFVLSAYLYKKSESEREYLE